MGQGWEGEISSHQIHFYSVAWITFWCGQILKNFMISFRVTPLALGSYMIKSQSATMQCKLSIFWIIKSLCGFWLYGIIVNIQATCWIVSSYLQCKCFRQYRVSLKYFCCVTDEDEVSMRYDGSLSLHKKPLLLICVVWDPTTDRQCKAVSTQSSTDIYLSLNLDFTTSKMLANQEVVSLYKRAIIFRLIWMGGQYSPELLTWLL